MQASSGLVSVRMSSSVRCRVQRCEVNGKRALPSTCTQSRQSLACRASYENPGSGNQNQEASRGVLDAFYVGRAFAETLSERLGSALGDALSDVAKQNAETQRALKDFQAEVEARAEADRQRAGMPAVPRPPQVQSAAPRKIKGAVYGSAEQVLEEEPDINLQETVDELRAEVAATRASVQRLKLVLAEKSEFK